MVDPLALGRSVVVDPGAPAPGPWAGCPRVRVAQVEGALADRLGAAWRSRQSLVIELDPGIGLSDPDRPPDEVVAGLQPWQWPVTLDLVAERLHHGIWANAVDARGGGGQLRWRWAEVALRHGATAHGARDRASRAGTGASVRSSPLGADVVLPGGEPAVCDGGPLDASLPERIGVAVVHSMALEHGSLRPLGPTDLGALALAPDQLAAVAEPGGMVRVIAPAGSGKTRVLTERARLLLGAWGLPAGAVALVAFNVRAAEEMRSRLLDVPGVRIRTLNALGLRLCGARATLEEPEVRRLLDQLVSFPRRAETDPAASWIEGLGRARLGLRDPEEVEEGLPDVVGLAAVAVAYRAQLAERAAADFDEQVVGAIERLLRDPGFRRRSQRHARVLLVDEFQDLTPAHLLLLRLLAGPAGLVFAVGDDDQTIYGYAGASPRWLVDFDQYFPGASSHALEVNYRCPAPVVRAAANLLTRNAVRVRKRIRASSAGTGPGLDGVLAPLSVLDGAEGPATRTAARVTELLATGAPPTDIAVLARVHASLAPVQVRLRHAGVPVAASVDVRFVRRSGVRSALAWLALSSAPPSALPGPVLREAARHPRRGMSSSLLDLVAKQRSVASLEHLAGWLDAKGSAREAAKVRELTGDVVQVRRAAERQSTAAVLAVVRGEIGDGGLDASAAALDEWSHGAIAAHGDDLQAMEELAELQPDPARFGPWLVEQLQVPADDHGVTVASVHAVKGREWPHVVLHHVSDGLLPHRLSDDVEEERRVFHVGLTRGAATVSIVPGHVPSPFLAELAKPGEPGDAVHPPRGTSAPSAPLPPSSTSPRSVTSLSSPRLPASSRWPGSSRAPESSRAPGSGRPPRSPASPVLPRSPVSGRPGCAPEPDPGLGSAVSTGRGRSRPGAELLPAAPGLVFVLGGHRHKILGTGAQRARVEMGEGPATTTVAYGTAVSVEGRLALLAHPAALVAWERLRAWRADQAGAMGKPAFTVFDDTTLRMVAALLPTSEPALLRIRGIGPVKLQSYGDDLIALADGARRQIPGSDEQAPREIARPSGEGPL